MKSTHEIGRIMYENYSKHILYCIGKWKRAMANILLQIVDCSHRDKLVENLAAIDQ
jgi:hypothetical protein